VKFDTPTDRALLLGSFVMAIVGQDRRMSYRLVRGGVIHIPTFPSVNNRDPIINHDITIRFILSSEREKVFPYVSRAFRERNRKVDKIELLSLAESSIRREITYIQII
jgi:hypothetical protein